MWVVGNATQAAQFYQSVFGMELVAYSGPETGNRDHHAYVLRSGAVRFVLTGASTRPARWPTTTAATATASSTSRWRCPTSTGASRTRAAQGATVLEQPHDVTDEHGTVRMAAIATYGETRHTLVDRSRYTGPYLPGYVARTSSCVRRDGAPGGCSRRWTTWSATSSWAAWTSGSTSTTASWASPTWPSSSATDIATEYSALMSKVVASGNHRVKFPLNEPAHRQEESPDRRVPGVLRRPGRPAPRAGDQRHPRHRRRAAGRGVEFLATPDSYYTDPELRARIGKVRVPIEELQQRGILVDRDEDGYLLQIFTKPIGDRPTVFFELIERHGSLGFGNGNFQALFEAIEREQARRGNF